MRKQISAQGLAHWRALGLHPAPVVGHPEPQLAFQAMRKHKLPAGLSCRTPFTSVCKLCCQTLRPSAANQRHPAPNPVMPASHTYR